MKKILFVLLMLLTMGISGFAQYPVTVTIGTGSSSTYTVPFDNFYKNSWDQMIYPASQIGVGGYITSIAFEVGAVPTSNYPFSTLTIYMGTSSDSVNSTTSSWLPMSELTEVYSATNVASPTATGWQTFTLNTPFLYDGSDNLVIVTSKTMSTYSSALKYNYTNGATNCCMYRRNDSDASYATHPGTQAASGRTNTRPNLQLSINVSSDFCYPVTNLAVTNLTATDATITWNNSNSSGASYILQYKTATQSWSNATTEDLNDTVFDMTGMLTATTTYNVRVATDCGGDTSIWKNFTFTTPCEAISTLPFTENFDVYTGATSTSSSTNNLPVCWSYLNAGTSTSYSGYPIIYNSSTYSASGSNSLRFYSYITAGTYDDQMAILPQIDPSIYPVSSLQLSFDARNNSTYTFEVVVGIIANPNDKTTFVPVDTIITTSNTYATYEFPFSHYTGPEGFIAFMAPRPSSSYNAGYIDNIVVDVIPTCPKPKNLATVSATLTSIELSWTEMGTATAWDIEYGPMGFTLGEGTTESVTTNPYTISGLDPSTLYDFYVKSNCGGGDVSYYSNVYTTATECAVIEELPYTEGFDTYGTGNYIFPLCWNRISTYTSTTAEYPYVNSTHYEGEGSLYFYAGSSGTYNIATTPEFDASIPINTLQATFMYRKSNATSRLIVGVMTNPADASTFTPIDTVIPAATGTWESFEVPFSHYTGTGQYIAFKNDYNSATGYGYLDSIVVDLMPSCPTPKHLTASNPTTTSIDLSWTEMGTATAWDIEYGPMGFTPGTGDIVPATTNPYTVTGLDHSTGYDFYVRANCGGGDVSNLSKKHTAATVCAPIDMPYFQNFDVYEGTTSTTLATTILPYCWTNISTSTSSSYTGYPIMYNNSTYSASGSNSLRFYTYYYSSSTSTSDYGDQIAILPEIDVTTNPINTLQLSMDVRDYSTSYAFQLIVGVMTNPASQASFTPVDTISTSSTTYASYTVDFSNYSGTGSYIALMAKRPTTSGRYNYGNVDNIIVEVIPSCPRPQNLTATSTITDEVILSWVDNNAFLWDVIYGPTGFDPNTTGAGTLVENVADTTYTVSGLDAGVIYDFYVRANCGGDFSTWNYAPVTAAPYTYVMGKNGGLTGTDTVTACNFIVTDDGGLGGSYSNNCNYTLVIFPGEPDSVVSVSGTFVGETTVDFLSVYDGTEATEANLIRKISSGTSGTVINFGPFNSTTGPLTLLFHSDGSVIYPGFVANVSCAEAPACPKPFDVHAISVNSTDATISWEANGSDNFSVVYSTSQNFNPDTCSNVFTTNTNNIYLSDLNPYTYYYVRVQSNCGMNMSEWSTVMRFRTTCEPIDQLPYIMNFDNVPGTTSTSAATTNLPVCWSNINAGTSTSYSGYPIVYTDASSAASGSNSMRFYIPYTTVTYDDQIAVLPAFDPSLYPVNNLQLSFEAKRNSTYTLTLVIGIVTNPTDISTFVPIDTITTSSSTYSYYEILFNSYSGTEGYIAIMAPQQPASNYNSGYVDNIVVDVIPACPRPDDFTVAGIASTSVDLTWTEVGEATAWEIVYGAPGFTPSDTSGEFVQVYDNPYTLENLDPATTYDIYVRSDCGGEYSQYVRDKITVTTACTPIDSLPFEEGFDTYSTGTSAYPTCWSKINTYTSSPNMPYISSTHYGTTGVGSLYFYTATTGTYNIAVMPMIDESIPVNTLQASFMYRASNASDRLIVGVLTNPTDASTFVAIDTIRPATSPSTWVEREVIFASYTGSGQYIAFKNAYTTTSCYTYIDNLVVDLIPSCPKPSQIHVVSNTTGSIELGWTENGSAEEWEIEYGPAGFTQGTGTIETTSVNPYIITGLNPSTTYGFYLRAICGVDDTSGYTPVYTAATQCAAIDFLPFTENFEAYSTGTTAYPICWSKSNTYTSSPNMPYISTTHYGTTGVGSLYFYTATSGTYNIAITPEFDASIPVNTLQATFMYRATNSTDKLIVGVMTNPADASTFVPVDTVTPASPASEWVEKEVAFNNYTGIGQYIAFKNAYTTTSCYTYIDNLYINLIPTCPKPNHLAVTDVTASTVTLDWQSVGSETSWEIAYGEVGFDPDGTTATIVSANAHPFTVQGLTDATSYQFYVRALCSASDHSYWTSQPVNATTLCDGAVSTPYTQDFEGYAGTVYNDPNGIAPACWTTFGTNPTYGAPHITSSGSYHYVHSGTNCMVFTCNSSGSTAYAALPTFDQALNTLHLNFWRAMESTTNGELTVGYATNLADFDNSYVVVATIPNVGSTTGDTISVDFTGAGIPATGNICFRWFKESTFYSCCIDDIEVTSNGSAPVVTDPTVATNAATSIAQTSATLNATITNPSGVTITAKGFEWRATTGGTYTQIAGSGTGNTFTANLTGLTANTGYTYKAFITFNGNTVYGSEMTFTTAGDQPQTCNVPTGLAASNITYNAADVNWTAGGTETAWNVQYKTGAADWTTVSANAATYHLSGLAAQTTYQVRVQAVCSATETSDWTAAISFTTEAEPVDPCNAPTNLQVSNITQTTATMTWTAGGTETAWKVGYKLASASQWQEATVQQTTYEIEGLTAGSNYDVRVKAVCAADNESDFITSNFTTGTSIDNVTLASSISLMPNPADNYIELSINSNVEVKEAVVFNAFGQMIQTVQLNNNHARIDLSNVASGMYFVRVNNDGVSATKKFIRK